MKGVGCRVQGLGFRVQSLGNDRMNSDISSHIVLINGAKPCALNSIP